MIILSCLLSLNLFIAPSVLYIFSECKECNNYNYLIDNKSIILQLSITRDKKDEFKYYLYKDNRFINTAVDSLKYKDVLNEFYKKNKTLRDKYANIFKDRGVHFIEIENGEYIGSIAGGDLYGDEYLCFFDGRKIEKIDIGNVMPHHILGESVMHYDRETKILYFTGEKIVRPKNERRIFSNYGIYAYSLKSKKVQLFLKKENDNRSNNYESPFRIPNTNKIITASTIIGHVEFIVKDMLRKID